MTATNGNPLEMRGARASSVIVQRIARDQTEVFLQWQRTITEATANFPGYQTTEIYPPSPPHEDEWVIVVHFDTAPHLQAWFSSPQRAECMAKSPCKSRDYRMQMLPSGFGAWFAGLDAAGNPIPHWKMALTVLLGLYPTVMILSLFLSPHTQRFGLAIAILLGNAASVVFLEWLGMPWIRRFVGPWLSANGKEDTKKTAIGAAVIVGLLVLMTLLFSLATRGA